MKRENRFFVVTYIYADNNDRTGFGNTSVTTSDGSYVNRQYFQEDIARQFEFKNVTVLNVTELSESDFEDYFFTKRGGQR